MTQATKVGYRNINGNERQYNNVRHADAVRTSGSIALERERRALREKTGAPVIVKKRVKSSPFPVSFIFYTVIMMLMLMFIIYNNSVVNEISYDISEVKKEMALEEQKNEKLSIELEKKYDLKEIERIAENELGLVKSTEVATHYVSVSEGDKVVVSESNNGGGDFGTSLNSFKKSVAKIYE